MSSSLALLLFGIINVVICNNEEDDLTVIVTENAINEKILSAYIPMLDEAALTLKYDGGSKDPCFDITNLDGGSGYCQWDIAYLNYFTHDDMKITLNSDTQQLEFNTYDISIHSKPFEFEIKEGVDCEGNATLYINHWNFSFNINIQEAEDCMFQLSVDEDSITIQETDELPVRYTIIDDSISNRVCEKITDTDNDRVQQLFDDLINNYMNDQLPTDIQKTFQKGLNDFITKGQHFDLSVDAETVPIYLCQHNLTITENHTMIATSGFVPDLSQNYTEKYGSILNGSDNDDIFIERIDHSMPASHWVFYICMGLLIPVFGCYGCYWCSSSIWKCCCKRKTDHVQSEIDLSEPLLDGQDSVKAVELMSTNNINS